MTKDIPAFFIGGVVPKEHSGDLIAAMYRLGATGMKIEPVIEQGPLPRIPFVPKGKGYKVYKKRQKRLNFKNAEMSEDGIYKVFRGKTTNAWLALDALKKAFPEPLKRAVISDMVEAAGNTGYTVNTALKMLEAKKLVKQTNTGHWVYTPRQ